MPSTRPLIEARADIKLAVGSYHLDALQAINPSGSSSSQNQDVLQPSIAAGTKERGFDKWHRAGSFGAGRFFPAGGVEVETSIASQARG
jgi:hypothetical protein